MALQIAIFLLSAAALGYEILLMRLLSIAHWQHFAAMIISLALLGYGASGSFATLGRRMLERHFEVAFASSAALFGGAVIGSFLVAQRLPFNALELPWHWRQVAILGELYLIFAVPFFFVGTCLVSAFTRAGGEIGKLYRADLAGAGAGAVGVLGLLSVASPTMVLKVLAGLGLAAAALFLLPIRRSASLALLVLGIGLNLTAPSWPRLQVSEFKPLAQILRIPGAVLVEERSNPLGFISVVESPRVPLRHAPGLSLNYLGELPEQVGIFTDAAVLTVINRIEPETLEYLDFLTSSLPYHVRRPSHVLVLNAGGGTDVLQALRRSVRKVDALELQREVVDLVARRYASESGNLYGRSEVKVHSRQVRQFLAAGDTRYDLIVDSSGAASGMPVLSENYVYTVEGLEQLIRHLAPAGMLSITRQVHIPPRDVLKLVATAATALERMGVSDSGAHLVLIRSWSTATLLVSRSRFLTVELDAVRRFCDERSFDVAFYRGMNPSEANRYNILDQPFYYEGAVAMTSANRTAFIQAYKFSVSPATDDRPFFAHFFRWKSLTELMRLRTRGGAPLLEIGYLTLVATLGQAVVASIVLIILPIAARSRSALRLKGAFHVVLCFTALGLAFLFVEIVFIQKLMRILGTPLVAVATTLGTFLIFGGVGSGMSTRVSTVLRPVVVLTMLITTYTFGWPVMEDIVLPWPAPARLAISVLLLAPLALTMGMVFPVTMRAVAGRSSGFIPWGWSINGCASVISPLAATLIAVHAGFTVVAMGAVALYAIAAFSFNRLTTS